MVDADDAEARRLALRGFLWFQVLFVVCTGMAISSRLVDERFPELSLSLVIGSAVVFVGGLKFLRKTYLRNLRWPKSPGADKSPRDE